MKLLIAFFVGINAFATAGGVARAESQAVTQSISSEDGVVVSATPAATAIGVQVLQQGGNAVDAAVAVGFALAVTWPEAGNLGGGGFMLVSPPDDDVVCVEYRETAPAAAHRDMFASGDKPAPHATVGVPGTVAGFYLAHSRYGQLNWQEVVSPSIALAREGFIVDRWLAQSLNDMLELAPDSPDADEIRRVYGPPDGTRWEEGERLVLPDLARTLQRIAEVGPAGFYDGPVAAAIAQEMVLGEGLITTVDLKGYQAKIRQPVHGTFRGFDIYSAPLPSSGGICIILAMNMLETLELRERGDRYSLRTMHCLAEVMRRVYYQRAKFLGDADFVDVPPELTDKEYAKRLAESISFDQATSSVELGADIFTPPESTETTHYSVVDADGLAVANTYTLEGRWGSMVVAPGTGVVLNNEMGDFNWRPGVTDTTGRIGTDANLIEPGKRMLSSQSPTIVRRDGKTVLVTGSPGGRTIINTVISILINRLEYNMDIEAAIGSPRQHHQWLPDRFLTETFGDDEMAQIVEQLRMLGHDAVGGDYTQGIANSIAVSEDGTATGVADGRGSSDAAALTIQPANATSQ